MSVSNKILTILIICSSSYAQELVTDRPDQTESAVTVPLNSLQMETGFVYENAKENNLITHTYSIAGTLLRYGLMNNLELRFGGGYLVHNGSETENDFDNLLLGCKVNFLREEFDEMDLGLLMHANVPLSSSFQLRKIEPELIFAASKTLNERISIATNIGAIYLQQSEEINYIYTGALGVSLHDNIGAFIELYGDLSSSPFVRHNVDGGLTYLLNNTLQLDLSAGKSLNKSDASWFISTGVSIRYDSQ